MRQCRLLAAEAERPGAIRLSVSQKTQRLLEKLARGMTPPDDLTVTEWAEKNRRLSAESAAEVGPWRTERTPYLREVMDCFTDPHVRHVVMVAASQVGKSEFLNNVIGYIIDEDPGSILFVHPTNVDAKEYSKLRIAPMIRDCPTLKSKVKGNTGGRRESANTILQKTYPGGILTLCGSTEAHALASKPIRYVLGDERDRWAASAGAEGDPWDLAMARQTTFYNAKALEVSTPTIKGASNIEAAYSQGTMERWKTQCPHCGAYSEIQWKDIRFEYDTQTVNRKKTYKINSIWYLCPECACISDEYTMKHQPARWEASNPEAYSKGCRSFWLNAFVSAWASWESIITKYLNALGSSRKMQVVYNTCFGELWEDRGDIEDEDSLLARRETYKAELPDGVLVLTMGVDTQDNRLEYEVLGHGHFGETWGIEHGTIMGRPDSPEVWAQLDDKIDHPYAFGNGITLKIARTFIDEGGHFTQTVREQCRNREHHGVFAIKGIAGPDHPYTSTPKQTRITINSRTIGTCWQYQIGVDSGKTIIMDNLRVQTPGAKYCHFPKRDDYGQVYFTGLLSERYVYKEGKKQPWQWEKIPGHERNEPLDIRNYALAAYKTLNIDLDAQDARLKAAAAQKDNPQPRMKQPAPQKRKRAGRPPGGYDW